jgi:DNA repair exonuclease SbcCD ATPase subunit
LGYGISNQFTVGTESERMAKIEEFFKLNIIEEMKVLLKERASSLSNQIIKMSSSLEYANKDFTDSKIKYEVLITIQKKGEEEAEQIIKNNQIMAFEKIVEDLQVTIDKCQMFIKEWRNTVEVLENRILECKTASPPILKIGTKCPVCRQMVNSFPEDYEQIIDKHEKELIYYNKLVEDKKKASETVNKYVDEASNASLKKGEIELKLNEEKRKVKEAQDFLNMKKIELTEIEKVYHEKENRYLKVKQDIDSLLDRKINFEKLRETISMKELRGAVISQYLEFINNYSKQYVSFLTNGEITVNFKFVNGKVEIILNNRGDIQNYFRFSGGERKRIDLGLFLAFNRLNSLIYHNPLNILEIDELADTLDKEGRERVVELLKKELRLGCVLITSHQEDIADLIGNKIKIIRKNGNTYLE